VEQASLNDGSEFFATTSSTVLLKNEYLPSTTIDKVKVESDFFNLNMPLDSQDIVPDNKQGDFF
jgi:hypothetical protein